MDFFAHDRSTYVTANALYARKSVDKLDIIALEDYSIKNWTCQAKALIFVPFIQWTVLIYCILQVFNIVQANLLSERLI
jgi:hypothetical protein